MRRFHLGSVVRVVEQGCPDTFGEQCLEAVVVCPGIADATVAIRTTGSGTRGTVILTTDGVGAGGYRIIVPVEGGEYVNGMMDSLLADGFKLVEIYLAQAWRLGGARRVDFAGVPAGHCISVGAGKYPRGRVPRCPREQRRQRANCLRFGLLRD